MKIKKCLQHKQIPSANAIHIVGSDLPEGLYQASSIYKHQS